ncbi:hypothetical protein GUA46_14390 [Muricauda sp. HICW]|uniref:Uncharacterized protein n=1 Tax=Flagellimonas chongwuensis TaxID=2697365 RepID=A0A850NMC5_9FLAO|nr:MULTISPECIES: hypothetical protein [Allomuricauda]NVN19535.1 hypothetical protein [Allomuricauda chongwuensis]
MVLLHQMSETVKKVGVSVKWVRADAFLLNIFEVSGGKTNEKMWMMIKAENEAVF